MEYETITWGLSVFAGAVAFGLLENRGLVRKSFEYLSSAYNKAVIADIAKSRTPTPSKLETTQ